MKYWSAALGPMLGLRQADIHLEKGHCRGSKHTHTHIVHTSQKQADDNIRDSMALSFNHMGNNEDPRLMLLGLSVCVCVSSSPYNTQNSQSDSQSNLPLKTVLIIPMMIMMVMISLPSEWSLLSVAQGEREREKKVSHLTISVITQRVISQFALSQTIKSTF